MCSVEKYSKIACIDIGTVTSRLALAKFDTINKNIYSIQKQSRICDLGEGLAESGILSDAAIARVLHATSDFVLQAHNWGAHMAVCTLTSASRDATNSAALLDGLRAQGLIPHIISGTVEARLTFMGVASDFVDQRIAICDSGGGSTELAIGRLQANGTLELEDAVSIQIGARRITDMFLLASNPPTKLALKQAYNYCYQEFSRCMPAAIRSNKIPLIAVGGTATSLVAIDKQLHPYNPDMVHLAHITEQSVAKLTNLLGSMTVEQRAQVVGLQPKRAKVILGGAISLQAMLQVANAPYMQVSEHDLLYGLANVAHAAQKGVQSFGDWTLQLSHL
ncbi:Ppx/GppA phosphatase family protein [Atopobium fossor]|uniref:Ppx/GppA phosphatase family protein n=1 Tax=Atopobium fossor TaxID=39487 RepID=UPI00041ABFCF|nr:hypothetical protein [Atopobium fossor]